MPNPASAKGPKAMLVDEAKLMGEWIRGLPLTADSVCLNVGSSTRDFRENVQPHIYAEVLRPIERAGARVVHCDLKSADGVDEAGDLLDPAVQARLRAYDADLLICSNLLEHLTAPAIFAKACASLVRPGGYGLFTVPRSFPYHPDPYDSMFRPSVAELAGLLPEWHIVAGRELEAGNYWRELKEGPAPVARLARQVARAALPIYRPTTWWPAAHQLAWLVKNYRVTMVLVQKPAVSPDGGAA